MGQEEEPLTKRPRSEEGSEKENSGEEICLDAGASKRTASIVVRKERMTMVRFVLVCVVYTVSFMLCVTTCCSCVDTVSF